MRTAVVAALLAIPLTAAAEPKFHDVVVNPTKRSSSSLTGGTSQFTTVSRTIYLNRCAPNGCDVYPGFDDSLTNHSSIPDRPSHLAAFPWGDQAWNNLVTCVREMYSPFDINITDVDPGTAPHFELMVGGNSTDIGIQGAGGVAPIEPCDGQLEENIISFVFAESTSNQDFLCWAAAQETSHVFGLDHELNAKDPMTYLSPPIKKEGFQNTWSDCGEDTPRECWCGGTKQNSYQYLMDTFGPKVLTPPTMEITSPKEGAWLKPGFTVRAEAVSQLSIKSASLQIDGVSGTSIATTPLVFQATNVPAGDHAIGVQATDAGQRSWSAAVNVHVVGACAANNSCESGFKCLGGLCLPGAKTPGGLGATCTENSECITGACGSDGTDSKCTGACDAGNTCPSGYACLESAGGGVCWPSADTGGCSATNSGGSPWLMLGGLGVLVAVLRRRR